MPDFLDTPCCDPDSAFTDAAAREVLDGIGAGCQVIGPDYRYLYVNDVAVSQEDLAREEMLGRTVIEVRPGIEETEMYGALRRCMEERAPQWMENEFAFPDGSKGWRELRIEPVSQGVTILTMDITRRKIDEAALQRSHRALFVLRGSNQTLVRATDERRFMDDLCRLAVDRGGYRMAWIGVCSQGAGQPVEPVAYAGPSVGDSELGKFVFGASDRAKGLVERAVRTGRAAIAGATASDEESAQWRADAKERGYASCIALPIIASGKTLGVLAIYAAEADTFDDAEVNLLDELALDLGYGMASLRAKVEREWAQELSRRAFLGSPVCALLMQLPERTVVDANQSFEGLFGYARAEILGRGISELGLWDPEAVMAPGDRQLRGRESEFVTRDGATGAGLFYSDLFEFRGETYALLKVIDITEHRRAEQEAREGRQLLFAFFEAPGMILAVFELDGDVPIPLLINKPAAAFFDLDRDRLPASGLGAMTPREAAPILAAARESLASGRAASFESRAVERGGSWFLTTVSNLDLSTASLRASRW